MKSRLNPRSLVKSFSARLEQRTAASLPWNVLGQLVSGLSSDTKLPREVLTGLIRDRDVTGWFAAADNLDFTEYESADLLLQDRLVYELFSKFNFVNSPFNKMERAKARFEKAESMCREANRRVGNSRELTVSVNDVIHRSIRYIAKVLGKFDVDEMLSYSRFGPGATLCVKGALTGEHHKLACEKPSCSFDAYPYASALLSYDVKWAAYLKGINPIDVVGSFADFPKREVAGEVLYGVNHNKVTFVPKNAKTLRSIAIEPYFNLYFQLGVGGMVRRRLYRRCNLNLDSQQRNRDLAHKGSLTDALATIDFSMASDTVSIETVRLLLPPEWFDHLDRLRSKNYVDDDGEICRYHKFSSMGNGFTFELETLIFFALAIASCDASGIDTEHVSVYGDDVIIPSSAVTLFTEAAAYLGFLVNEEKSFVKGPFRESCGEDFFKGFRVRPVFCKELSTVQDIVKLHNRLFRLREEHGWDSRVAGPLSCVCDFLMSRIPRDVSKNVVGPPEESVDSHIFTRDFAVLTNSPLVRWDYRTFCWVYPKIAFSAYKLAPVNTGALCLWVNFGLDDPSRPIPKVRNSLTQVFEDRALGGTPLGGRSAREITGRKIGCFKLGHGRVWHLVRDAAYGVSSG